MFLHSKIMEEMLMKNKIVYDLSIVGATRAGAYVFAKSLHDSLKQIQPLVTYYNPFHSYSKKGINRKIHSLMRMIYMEFIVFSGKKRDIYFFPAPEVPFSVIFLKRTYIVTIYDLYAWNNKKESTYFAKIKNKFLPYIAKNAKSICTISEFSKQEISSLLNIEEESIFVVNLGLDKVFTEKIKIKNKNKNKNKISDLITGKYILNVGSLEPRKNIVYLIEVFEKIKEKLYANQIDTDLQLVLTGSESWNNKQILQKLQTSIYKNDIVILGHVRQDDLPLLYKNASAMVFPSKAEGFGLPVIESLSQGTPVIVNANTSLTFFEQYGARVMKHFDVDKWCNEIFNIIVKSNRIDNNDVHKTLSDFSWEKTASDLLNHFDTLKT